MPAPKYEKLGYKFSKSSDTSCSINLAYDNGDSSEALLMEEETSLVDGGTLSFHDIYYTVQVKKGRFRKTLKTILREISGVFKPGLNAILGPTGSGKTTLLDIIAARKDPTGLAGRVLLDGKPFPHNVRLSSGYVTQDDIVMATLTVRENLSFSAALRLPSSVTDREREKIVDNVLSELNLWDCADTRVGSQIIKGVSGGEKRRTCIGMELIVKPTFIFLDEPTSGLDAHAAWSVMAILSRLSKKGHTIVCILHQPRYQIFRLVDKILLLSNGQTVYHGEAKEAVGYFSKQGYECEEHDNPADFLLDTIMRNQRACSGLTDTLETKDTDGVEALQLKKNFPPLSECYRKSEQYIQMKSDADSLYAKFKLEDEVATQNITYNTSFGKQLRYTSRRAFLNWIRHPQLFFNQILMHCIVGTVVGSIYFQLSGPATNAIQDRYGVLFMISVFTSFNHISLDAFIQDRHLFLHELSGGYYRPSVLVLSKIIFDLIPSKAIPSLLYGIIVYWMIGLRPEWIYFFYFLLNIQLCGYAFSGFYTFLGCCVDKLVDGLSIAGLFMLTNVVFSGFLMNVGSMSVVFAWMRHVSLVRYLLSLLLTNEFSGREFCNPYPFNSTCFSGDAFLESQDVAPVTWIYQVILGSVALVFFVLIYIKIRTLPRYK